MGEKRQPKKRYVAHDEKKNLCVAKKKKNGKWINSLVKKERKTEENNLQHGDRGCRCRY